MPTTLSGSASYTRTVIRRLGLGTRRPRRPLPLRGGRPGGVRAPGRRVQLRGEHGVRARRHDLRRGQGRRRDPDRARRRDPRPAVRDAADPGDGQRDGAARRGRPPRLPRRAVGLRLFHGHRRREPPRPDPRRRRPRDRGPDAPGPVAGHGRLAQRGRPRVRARREALRLGRGRPRRDALAGPERDRRPDPATEPRRLGPGRQPPGTRQPDVRARDPELVRPVFRPRQRRALGDGERADRERRGQRHRTRRELRMARASGLRGRTDVRRADPGLPSGRRSDRVRRRGRQAPVRRGIFGEPAPDADARHVRRRRGTGGRGRRDVRGRCHRRRARARRFDLGRHAERPLSPERPDRRALPDARRTRNPRAGW